MNVYKGYDSGKIEDIGNVSRPGIEQLLREAVESIGNNDFCIGLNRSDKDFVEIRPVGNSQYIVWSDRLCKIGSFWQRFLQTRNIEKIVEGESNALQAIEIYINKPREHFEQTYT
mgnify:CR=1 FL=1